MPAEFIRLRDNARAKAAGNADEPCPDLEGSDIGSETAESEATQVNSSAATESTVHSDGLLVENEIIDQMLETVVQEVQVSLSSVALDSAGPSTAAGATDNPAPVVNSKRDDELAGLEAAISNAVKKGSCSADKLAIVEKAKKQSPPPPESPPDAPRDPRDRRKRMRSGCFRYVSRSDVPNSLSSLTSELKLIFSEDSIGLKLSEIFAALEDHPDKPLDDTWSGVSTFHPITAFLLSLAYSESYFSLKTVFGLKKFVVTKSTFVSTWKSSFSTYFDFCLAIVLNLSTTSQSVKLWTNML